MGKVTSIKADVAQSPVFAVGKDFRQKEMGRKAARAAGGFRSSRQDALLSNPPSLLPVKARLFHLSVTLQPVFSNHCSLVVNFLRPSCGNSNSVFYLTQGPDYRPYLMVHY